MSGEHYGNFIALSEATGSSPRERGALFVVCLLFPECRIIPA